MNDLLSTNKLVNDFFMFDSFKPYYSYETFSSKSNENDLEVTLTVPGYGKEDLEVNFSDYDGCLLISSKDKKLNRAVNITNPNSLDLQNIKAKCLNGILTITLPYKKSVPKHKILIE